MRLVATEYVSLDGVFEEPGHWSLPFFNEEAGQFKSSELQASDALLLGRKTYEGFAAAWPTMEGAGEFGERIYTNGMRPDRQRAARNVDEQPPDEERLAQPRRLDERLRGGVGIIRRGAEPSCARSARISGNAG